MIYTAKNSRFNREANLLQKTIWLIEKKNGTAYFAINEIGNNNIFCSCEESLFDKEFSPEPEAHLPAEMKILVDQPFDVKKVIFKRYPIDLKTKTK